MTDRWQHVSRLYHAALAHEAPTRAAFLHEACVGDEMLQHEVESLLAHEEAVADFIETPALHAAASLGDTEAEAPAMTGGQIGPYKILSLLGVGGMGEVYRARDTKLGRDVAIKILPSLFTDDPDRRARFEREARLLASLNHSNIAQIHGLEDADVSTVSGPRRVQALVMELVPGETLAEMLSTTRPRSRRSGSKPAGQTARGLSLDKALALARQIAEALEAAHEKGIVHRDLKPANIKVTPDGVVKVLDFGLAKATTGDSASPDRSHVPTITDGTREGSIVGTAAYMSPEQARGQPVDKRTDIWAFGCVLYEMLTGRIAFAGETSSDTLAQVLTRDPDWTALPAATPPLILRVLRRCLERDRTRRLADMADARLDIDDAMASPAAQTLAIAAERPRRVTPVTIAALAGGAAIAALVVWTLMRPAPVAPPLPVRFAIVPPAEPPFNVSGSDRDLTVSPDGRHLVYRAGGDPFFGSPLLMVRTTDQLDAHQLSVMGALGVFSSPDSRWIGFFTTTALKKVSITGGPAITLCQISGAPLGASWGDDNTIVFATNTPSTGLWRVSADGGEPTVLTTPDAAQHEGNHAFPSVLPGGRGVLFTITAAGQANNAQVVVLDLTTGRRKTLVRGGSQAEYVDPSVGTGQAGYLIYAAADTLRAVRFDPARLEVLSDPVTVVEHVLMKPTGAADYAVSRQGTLLYVPGGVGVQTTLRSLVWVDRKGHEEPIKAPLLDYGPLRISPDGTRVVLEILDPNNTHIWILDLVREQLRRLTSGPGNHGLPLWTRDGRRIIFNSDRVRSGVRNLYSQAADGTGTVDRLTTSANSQFLASITPDGTAVVASENRRVLLFPLTSPASPPGPGPSPGASASRVEPSAQSLFDGTWAEFSPNGRYLAYTLLDESGRREVYVRPFPQVDRGRWQISRAGGTRPAWARNGRELFYLDASNTLTAVPVQTSGSTFSAGKPAKVFDAKYAEPNPPRYYDVSPDGQRFLMIKNSADGDPPATPPSMVVVLNWLEELKQRVNGK